MMTLRPAVRRGLRSLVAQPGRWPADDPFIFQNLLLDECSSDARPLVRLVLRAGELGIPDRIERSRREGTPWTAARAPMVLSLVEELFVQSEVAQWVVDTWAIALGVMTEPNAAVVAGANGASSGAVGTGTGTAARRSAAAPPRGTPRPRAGAGPARGGASARMQPRTVVPLPAGAAASGGATRRPMQPPPSVSQMLVRHPVIWGSFLLLLTVMGFAISRATSKSGLQARSGIAASSPSGAMLAGNGASDGAVTGTGGARAGMVPDAGNGRAADPAAVAAAGGARGVSALTPNALPGVGPNHDRVLAVTPATRPNMPAGPGAQRIVQAELGGYGLPGSPQALRNSNVAAERKPDRIELRNGRVITGRVELVRPSVVIIQEWESGLRFELAKSDIASITTEFNTTVRFNTEGFPSNERVSPLVKRGVGGTYEATYRVLDVRGSRECAAIFAQAQAPERVVVTHVPGADTLTMVFASGKRFATVVDPVGQFATSFAIAEGQAQTSTALTTRLEGRFGMQGFDAITHVIAFRRAASGGDLSCYAQIGTTGVRVVGGGR